MKTKKILSQAMVELLANHKADQITVQMVLDEAQVSRTTFYRHFQDLHDLMLYLYRDYLENLENKYHPEYFRQNMLTADTFLMENRGYFQKILRSEKGTIYSDFLRQHVREYFTTMMLQCFHIAELSPLQDAQIEFLSLGASGLTCKWLLDGCRFPPHDLVAVISGMVPEPLRSALNGQEETQEL